MLRRYSEIVALLYFSSVYFLHEWSFWRTSSSLKERIQVIFWLLDVGQVQELSLRVAALHGRRSRSRLLHAISKMLVFSVCSVCSLLDARDRIKKRLQELAMLVRPKMMK